MAIQARSLIAIFIFGPLFLTTMAAAAVAAEPDTVNVGIYVLNVGKFDVSTGAYTVDFYLSFQCDKPCAPENFEFMNGRAASVDKIIDEPNNKFYRIQADLMSNIDLKDYPFDRHALSITIEDKHNTDDKQVYLMDAGNSGVDKSVTLVGWNLVGWDARSETHTYEQYGEDYSRFIFDIDIERIFLASILKTFLPVLFIVLAGLLSLMIEKPSDLWTRLGVNTSSLMAAVMFHLNVTSSIPPVGYLTFADKFMMATYVILVLSLLSTIVMMMHAKKGEEKLVRKLYRYSLYGIPTLALAAYLLLFISAPK